MTNRNILITIQKQGEWRSQPERRRSPHWPVTLVSTGRLKPCKYGKGCKTAFTSNLTRISIASKHEVIISLTYILGRHDMNMTNVFINRSFTHLNNYYIAVSKLKICLKLEPIYLG